MGGEIRVELTFRAEWHPDYSVTVNYDARLYEGASESTRDLDAQAVGRIELVRDSNRVEELTLVNREWNAPTAQRYS
jgi:hypothetical protein